MFPEIGRDLFFYHTLARIVECVSECIILISKETKPKITRQQQKNKTNNNKKQEPKKKKREYLQNLTGCDGNLKNGEIVYLKKKKKKAMLFKFVNLYSVRAGPYRTNHLSLEIMLNPPK